MKHDDFGDRMKTHEDALENRASSDKYLIVRADGRAFSKFTSNYKKPFDDIVTNAMNVAGVMTADEFNADAVYIQSDEITFLFKPKRQKDSDILRDHVFSGRTQKIVSLISSSCSVHFYKMIEEKNKTPIFDARAMIFDDEHEACNAFYWRALDAKRNAVSGFYRYQFGHKKMQNKSEREMLAENETTQNWKDLSDDLKYGRLYLRTSEYTERYSKVSSKNFALNSTHEKRLELLNLGNEKHE